VSTPAPPAADIRLVVGYDGSPPAVRALDSAARLLQGRTGQIDVTYIAHLPSVAALSAGAVGELEENFDEVAEELRAVCEEQLRGQPVNWRFEWRQGAIVEELIAAAKDIHAAEPLVTVVIVVGASSLATHRVVGSVAVGLARHSPVPLIVVP
jgi:nucleotide-binding universal stress UspA family protein